MVPKGRGMDAIIVAKAAWINGRELAHDAAIIVRGGRVHDIVPRAQISQSMGAATEMHETALLLPGFINAHAHLEYTNLQGRLPRYDDRDFCEWLEAVYELKHTMMEDACIASVKAGIDHIIAGGATTIIDSTHRSETVSILAESPLRFFTFCEVIAFDQARAAAIMDGLHAMLVLPRGQRCAGVGVNPHAPYTVGAALRARLLVFLRNNPGIRCAWHLCESSAEMQLFEHGDGPMADFLSRHGLDAVFDDIPRCRPDEFLARENLLDRCDVAFHMNHPIPETGAFFRAPRMITHCPATHEYFHREPFPLWQLMNDGANIALGTDSGASSDSLSMLDMLRMAGRTFPSLTGPQLLNLAGHNAAQSCVLREHDPPLGVISRDAAADFVAIDHPAGLSGDLREILMSPDTRIASLWIAGRKTL
ncbi:MAG: amidohydrolase family protein [Candidatus Sumerlaeota bacterium]|nr:amidohydrolase family protein [Candidatus Sumerlaeota bacterium]